MTNYDLVIRFIKRIHREEPYKTNKNTHRFFVIDLKNDFWFFVHNGENKQLEETANNDKSNNLFIK